MSNMKSINENSLNNRCITMTGLSNKTNEKADLFETFNDNKIIKGIKRFTGRKRKNENSNNRKCCKCKNEVSINDSIEFKNKEELISKNKGIIKMKEIKYMNFKEHQIICKSCFDTILKDEDCNSIIKQIFFSIEKKEKTKQK